MIITGQEFADTLNKINETHGNSGVLAMLRVLEVLEQAVKKGVFKVEQKNGKTYFSLGKKARR